MKTAKTLYYNKRYLIADVAYIYAMMYKRFRFFSFTFEEFVLLFYEERSVRRMS